MLAFPPTLEVSLLDGRKLWSLQLPIKIRILCWKACRGILSTCSVLFKRGIVESKLYCFCGKRSESADHAVYVCKVMRFFWSSYPILQVVKSYCAVDFLDRLLSVFRSHFLKT
ncbi:hypothetical protein ACOSQ2_012388 [Xanthoceras sorbifolium]